MKKVTYFSFVCILALLSCNKVEKQVETPSLIHKTFEVGMEDTKTGLAGDGVTVNWSNDDAINLIAATSHNQYTFSIVGTPDGSRATFSGVIDSSDAGDTFYAVYPDVNATFSSNIIEFLGSASGDHIKYFVSDDTPVTAIKDGFDGRYAPMTGVVENGSIAFRHGAAFFKITVGSDGVQKIKLSAGDKARFNGRPKYTASTGVNSTVESAKAFIYAQPASGYFEKGATYYIPVLTKQSKVGTLTVDYILADGTTTFSKTTATLTEVVLTAGKIYDLGTPPITVSPIIDAADMTINKDDTSESIAFSILNPVTGGVLTTETTSGKTNTIDNFDISSVGASSVTFTCDANTGSSPKYAYVTLKYTYNTSEEVTKDVVITQRGAAIHKDWNFSDTAWDTQFAAASSAYQSNQASWTVSYDGLTYTSGTKNGKWDWMSTEPNANRFIQPNGGGSATERVFSFTAAMDGTVTVYFTNTGNNTTRTFVVKDSSEPGTQTSTVTTTDAATMKNESFNVKAGEVKIYPNAGLRFYRFKFDSE